MIARRLFSTLALAALAIAGGIGCSDDAPGLMVTVDLKDMRPAQLKLSFSADPGGFKGAMDSGQAGVEIKNETDANGADGLVILFSAPAYTFGGQVSFRLETKNQVQLKIGASALAFDGSGNLIGRAAPKTASLPAGGQGSVALTLQADSGQIGASTRTTDLAGNLPADKPDLQVRGRMGASLTPLAVCNLDGMPPQDLIVGAPNDDDARGLGSVGAVYVVFGGASGEVDLADPGAAAEIHFFGRDGTDHLGTSVACADLNADGYGDLIAGAPGADNGAGRVYVVYGGAGIRSRTINLISADKQPDAQLRAAAGAQLGMALFAGVLGATAGAELLVSAPGARKVHLLTGLTPSATPRDLETDPHVTFSNVTAGAMGGGRLDGGNLPDIVLGDATYRPMGEVARTGITYVFANVVPSSSTAYAVDGTGALMPQALTISGAGNAQVGAAVMVVDTTGTGDDLLVGAPGEGDGTGAVHIFQHDDSDFFTDPQLAAAEALTPLRGLSGTERFGSALGIAASGAGMAGGAVLIVGAPDATRNASRAHAGAAYLFAPGADRRFPLVEQMFGAAANDRLGTAVAGGRLDGNMVGDMVASAPATGNNAGSVYVRLGQAP